MTQFKGMGDIDAAHYFLISDELGSGNGLPFGSGMVRQICLLYYFNFNGKNIYLTDGK